MQCKVDIGWRVSYLEEGEVVLLNVELMFMDLCQGLDANGPHTRLRSTG